MLAAQCDAQAELLALAVHGAVRRGLHIGAIAGGRRLCTGGGQIALVERGRLRLVPVPPAAPIPLRLIAGGSSVDVVAEPRHAIPSRCCAGAGGAGDTAVEHLPEGDLRVDLLALEPGDPPTWWLVLGSATHEDDASRLAMIPTPAPAPGLAAQLVPLARIASRGGARQIISLVPLAPRMGG